LGGEPAGMLGAHDPTEPRHALTGDQPAQIARIHQTRPGNVSHRSHSSMIPPMPSRRAGIPATQAPPTRTWRSLAGNAGPGPVDPGRSRPPESGGPGYDVGRARPATQVAEERHLTPSALMRSWVLERLAQESSGESLLAVVRKAVRATSY